MRKLYLLRHAKAVPAESTVDDFDRRLAKRGLAAAPRMGCEMCRLSANPDLVLCSAAARAVETWNMLCTELSCTPHVETLHALYMADAANIMECVRQVGAEAEELLVIGHNPGLERFAAQLASTKSRPAAVKRMREKFPTCALAVFRADIDDWADLEWRGADLTFFHTPRNLA